MKEERLLLMLTLVDNYRCAVAHLDRAELLLSNVFTLANIFTIRTDFILTWSCQLRNLIGIPDCKSPSAALYVQQNGPVAIKCGILCAF